LYAVLFIPLSVAAMGELLSGIAMALVQRRQRDLYERYLQQELTIEHLKVMDFDKNGQISREEYVQFMLLEMGRVTRQEIDELYMQFDRLDVTASGYLDNADLELMALRGASGRGS
jgi:Ca2+-binding EF-hand superfamily protein